MKKFFLVLSLLLSLGTFCACSNDDETVNVYVPIEEGEDYAAIANFIQSNYDLGTEHRCFFEDSNERQCLVISSTNELISRYTGVEAFPDVNFNKYMLIVGQEMMPSSYHTIQRQELVSKDGDLELNLYIPQLESGYGVVQHLFYWGLYPKMQHSKISVTIHKGL